MTSSPDRSTTSRTNHSSSRGGTAAAALRERPFRIMWFGGLASGLGTWMQNVLLAPFALDLARRTGGIRPATFAGIVLAAQLVPYLFGPISGMLGDRLPTRPYLIVCQIEQLLGSLLLAWLVSMDHPNKFLFVLVVLAIGFGNAFNNPVWSSVLPAMVRPENLSGAVALNSLTLNGARAIGPVLVVVLRDSFGVTTSGVFLFNAATYLFVIYALVAVRPPARQRPERNTSMRASVMDGIRTTREIRVLFNIITSVPFLSAFVLTFVPMFAAIAEHNLGIDSDSSTYRWLYATFGLGACFGGLGVATVWSHVDPRIIPRRFLYAMGAVDTAYALVSSTTLAFPIVFAVGFCYFGLITSWVTVLQTHSPAQYRARVMALWFVGFGGMTAFASLWGGFAIDHWSARGMLLIGAAVTVLLGRRADLVPLSEQAKALGQVP
ncbi:MAG: MFS transporter [Acidimicrobiia bacterium]